MRCTGCGHDNRETAAFCESCGGRLAVVCARCANELRPGARFCDGCGQAVAAPAEPSHTSAPHAHTPRHLAEKMLANRAALEGERKQVTVLFADVVGSTELIRDRDPEEAQRLLDGAVRRMMDAVHRYEGTVSRLTGDGLMAMFGAPVAHEDHAVRACYAALAMMASVREYADEARRAHGAAIQIRVGINSGEVVVRLISDDLHLDYTAMGQTVHLASRMEGLATAGAVLLSPSTLALAEGFIDVRPLGPTTVRGLEQPVEVYELIGAGMARTRLQASAARGLTPFVGRQEERAAIERALERTRAGHGQVVALVAEAGVGKSRLVWEVTRSDNALECRVIQTGAVSYGLTTTWLPVIDLLRTYLQIDSRDDHAVMREKVSAGLLALDPVLEPASAALLSLPDVPVEDAVWAQRDPAQRRRATLNAVQQLLLRESQRQPLLLVFEDLHWIDSETQALLDVLVESLPTAHILLIVNYRPEYSHGWGNKSYYTQLRIDPLGAASADELLTALLGDDPSVEPLKTLLIGRTDGNPFFLEESVRTLVETGALVGERGAYRLARPVEEVRVPATVQAVLAARIDRLPPEEKRLLQTTAVIGKDAPLVLLQAITDGGADELQAIISRLQAAEFLYPVSLFPEPELTFKHALTHEVAYGSLLQERRKTLHARIVEAIERLYSDRLGEHVERLAHHALRAEDWEQAAAYCRQAGAKATGHSAVQDAVTYFDLALGALGRIPESPDVLRQTLDIRLELHPCLNVLGLSHRYLDNLQHAEEAAERLGDRADLGRVCVFKTSYHYFLGAYDQAVNAGQQALAIAAELHDRPLLAIGHLNVAYPYLSRGDLRETARHLAAAVRHFSGDRVGERYGQATLPSVASRAELAGCLAELGAFPEAAEQASQAMQIADAMQHPYSLTFACSSAGYALLRRGDLAAAVSVLNRSRSLAEAWDHRRLMPIIVSRLGLALSVSGHTDEGLALLQEATAHITAHRGVSQNSTRAAWLGEAYFRAGRPSEALRCASEALAGAARRDEKASQAWALRLLGEIAAHGDVLEVEQAEQRYQQALRLAESLEMRPLQAHCHLGLGKLYRRTGRPDEARAELVTAAAMLREMGMAFWLPEAERELGRRGDSGASGRPPTPPWWHGWP